MVHVFISLQTNHNAHIHITRGAQAQPRVQATRCLWKCNSWVGELIAHASVSVTCDVSGRTSVADCVTEFKLGWVPVYCIDTCFIQWLLTRISPTRVQKMLGCLSRTRQRRGLCRYCIHLVMKNPAPWGTTVTAMFLYSWLDSPGGLRPPL